MKDGAQSAQSPNDPKQQEQAARSPGGPQTKTGLVKVINRKRNRRMILVLSKYICDIFVFQMIIKIINNKTL
jgi:hypothetical protein